MRPRVMVRCWVLGALLASAAPASAQMDTMEWIEDVKWHATLGTGIAAETGGVVAQDPVLLFFGGNVRKSWRWWYGLTFESRVDLYTQITDCPMVPYKLAGEVSLSLGPQVFRMVIGRAEAETEFGSLYGAGTGCRILSTGKRFRLAAGTLPTFAGLVTIQERFILTYRVAPLSVVVGLYDEEAHPGADDDVDGFNLRPYTGAELMLGNRVILSEWAQIHGELKFFKAWSEPEARFRINLGVAIGILQNAVQFGLNILWDLWNTPLNNFIWDTATFTLSARLRI